MGGCPSRSEDAQSHAGLAGTLPWPAGELIFVALVLTGSLLLQACGGGGSATASPTGTPLACSGSIWVTDAGGTPPDGNSFAPGQQVFVEAQNLPVKDDVCLRDTFILDDSMMETLVSNGYVYTDAKGDVYAPQLVFDSSGQPTGTYLVRVTCGDCVRSDYFFISTPVPAPQDTATAAPTPVPSAAPTSTPAASATVATSTPAPIALRTAVPPNGCEPKTPGYWTSRYYDGPLQSSDVLTVLRETLMLNISTGYLNPAATYQGKPVSQWLSESVAIESASDPSYATYVNALNDIVNGTGVQCVSGAGQRAGGRYALSNVPGTRANS